MTETPILSGGATATDDGVGMLPAPPDADGVDSAGGNRRRLMIIGTVAGVIVLAAAAYLLLHKSSPSTPTAAVVPHGVVSAPASTHPAAKTKTHTGGTTTVPKVGKKQTVRDPFLPLIAAPVDTGTSTGSTTVPAGSTSPTTPVTTPTPTPTSTTSTGTGNTGGPQWIELMSTNGNTAVFRVGYAHHTFHNFKVQAPKASSDQGTIFAKIFALISVQTNEATIQIGDAAPFVLQTGTSHVA
jgi:hypothetical protein